MGVVWWLDSSFVPGQPESRPPQNAHNEFSHSSLAPIYVVAPAAQLAGRNHLSIFHLVLDIVAMPPVTA